MRAKYNVNGNQISAYLWSDLLFDKDTHRTFIEVSVGYGGKEIRKNLHKDEKGLFFYWDRIPVYVNEFTYYSAEELIALVDKAIETNDWVFEDDILATLLKESDKLNVVYPLPKIDMVIPFLGFAITGTKTKETVCKFTEDRYKKEEWHYKVSLAPVDESMNMTVVSRHPYFSDLCTEIRKGEVKLRLAQEKATA